MHALLHLQQRCKNIFCWHKTSNKSQRLHHIKLLWGVNSPLLSRGRKITWCLGLTGKGFTSSEQLPSFIAYSHTGDFIFRSINSIHPFVPPAIWGWDTAAVTSCHICITVPIRQMFTHLCPSSWFIAMWCFVGKSLFATSESGCCVLALLCTFEALIRGHSPFCFIWFLHR